MYFPDVVSLKEFYASGLGVFVRNAMKRRLRRIWPAMPPGEALLAFGFPTPFFDGALVSKDVTIAMPASIGALYFPAGKPNRVALVHEDALPFSDQRFNRALAVHALEHSARAIDTLRELWRVIVPGGRVLIAVPNRMGVWAQSHANPFGYGRPFSVSQMRQLLTQAGFTYLRHEAAFSLPPASWRWYLAMMPYAEAAAALLFPRFGGVLLIEAEKQVYAAVLKPAPAAVPARVKPVRAPAPA